MAASFDVAFKRSPIKTLHSAITTPTGVVEAQSVGFSFYSAAEVRKISVVQVHTAEQRDAHNRPLPGGLYDPAMGPTDQFESCKTCGLDYTTCPGHLGHIELALPAYTPVLFPQLVTLLRSTCLLCHRLKADAGKLRILADALRLLDAGLLVDATVLMEGRAATGGGGGGGGDDDDVDVDSDDSGSDDEGAGGRNGRAVRSGPLSDAARRVLEGGSNGGGGRAAVRTTPLSTHEVALRRRLHHKIQRTMLHGAKCSRCGRSSGAIKGEGGHKIFCTAPRQSAAVANAMLPAGDGDGDGDDAGEDIGGSDTDDDDSDDSDGDSATPRRRRDGARAPRRRRTRRRTRRRRARCCARRRAPAAAAAAAAARGPSS